MMLACCIYITQVDLARVLGVCLPLREDKNNSSGLGSSLEEKETINSSAALPHKQRNRIKPILETLQTLPDLSVKRQGTNAKCKTPNGNAREMSEKKGQKPEDKPDEKQDATDDFKKSLREELSKERRIANTDEEKQAKLTQTKTTAENKDEYVKESQHYSRLDALDQRNVENEILPEAQKLPKQILNGNCEEAHDLDKIVIQEPNDKQDRDEQSNQNRSVCSTCDQVQSEQGQGSLSLDHTTECNVTSSYHISKDETAPGPSNSDQLPQREKALSEELEEIKAPPNAPKLDHMPKETSSDKFEQIKCPSCHHQFTGVRQRVLLLLRTHLGKMHFHR